MGEYQDRQNKGLCYSCLTLNVSTKPEPVFQACLGEIARRGLEIDSVSRLGWKNLAAQVKIRSANLLMW